MTSHDANLELISSILNDPYDQEETRIVPKRSDLTFGNTLKTIKHAVVFYVDMRGSKKILHTQSEFWSVKTHRAFLQAIVYSVERREGHFRSFNGDGALAFFVGEHAAARAVRAAMDLKGYIIEINKILDAREKMTLDFGVGLGQGSVHVAKSGKRGDDSTKQDLIWVGIPTYVAVELSDKAKNPNNIWISKNVYNAIVKDNDYQNIVSSSGKSLWTQVVAILGSVGLTSVYCTSRYFKVA